MPGAREVVAKLGAAAAAKAGSKRAAIRQSVLQYTHEGHTFPITPDERW